MHIAVRAYRQRWPTFAQAVPSVVGAAMWGWSTSAIMFGNFREANPVWLWLPLPWMLVVQAAVILGLSVLPWMLDEPVFSMVFIAPWAVTLVHDILAVLVV